MYHKGDSLSSVLGAEDTANTSRVNSPITTSTSATPTLHQRHWPLLLRCLFRAALSQARWRALNALSSVLVRTHVSWRELDLKMDDRDGFIVHTDHTLGQDGMVLQRRNNSTARNQISHWRFSNQKRRSEALGQIIVSTLDSRATTYSAPMSTRISLWMPSLA